MFISVITKPFNGEGDIVTWLKVKNYKETGSCNLSVLVFQGGCTNFIFRNKQNCLVRDLTEIFQLPNCFNFCDWMDEISKKSKQKVLLRWILSDVWDSEKSFFLELNSKLHLMFMPSDKNKGRAPIRIEENQVEWTRWVSKEVAIVCCLADLDLKKLHRMHHLRTDRTLFWLEMVDPDVTKEAVWQVIRSHDRCQLIDAMMSVKVKDNWKWLAVDFDTLSEQFVSSNDCLWNQEGSHMEWD